MHTEQLKIRRVLMTVTDKTGIVELAKALRDSGAEIVATGKTAQTLESAGLSVTPIESVSGSPEAFQGRMKTLSFPVCSGILYRRGDLLDEQDLARLKIQPIDCVVVNFYPFEQAAQDWALKQGDRSQLVERDRSQLIEQIDIGGPTLVRAAAKNSPDVLVLTSSSQYAQVIDELKQHQTVSYSTAEACAEAAWERIHQYDTAIFKELGARKKGLRYGENPHQKGYLEFDPQGPIAWDEVLTSAELSYNNILDVSAAYGLASDLIQLESGSTGVVIVKHNNPCGVALVPQAGVAQKTALQRAWEGDPVSAFGGVLVFTHPLTEETATWLSQHFVELIAAPELTPESAALKILLTKRKNLKAVRIRRFGEVPSESSVAVPGARLCQTTDLGLEDELRSVTQVSWPSEKERLARFGIAICRALKSNAIALVRELSSSGVLQLVGAGQGQPNRVEALKSLAIPRAEAVLRSGEGKIGDCVMISDAFFPFRDTVDAAYASGIRYVVQPGGSLKDGESVQACDEHGMAMVFTGIRHFRH